MVRPGSATGMNSGGPSTSRPLPGPISRDAWFAPDGAWKRKKPALAGLFINVVRSRGDAISSVVDLKNHRKIARYANQCTTLVYRVNGQLVSGASLMLSSRSGPLSRASRCHCRLTHRRSNFRVLRLPKHVTEQEKRFTVGTSANRSVPARSQARPPS